jgi:hypothetical protein
MLLKTAKINVLYIFIEHCHSAIGSMLRLMFGLIYSSIKKVDTRKIRLTCIRLFIYSSNFLLDERIS